MTTIITFLTGIYGGLFLASRGVSFKDTTNRIKKAYSWLKEKLVEPGSGKTKLEHILEA